ncbi:LuxR C-terminal-related transcriptional regulator [Actinokineospora sp. HUAS TT18]|uniref:helix-turn-helix transcriptional regulator n=1 Tax=Actinokineospora sp. HUAS TT18 TaxID=3447451 RepID=UPI003F51CA90
MTDVLRLLHAAMDAAPRVVCCSGEPGSGKTTLLRRFADEVARRGVLVRAARSFGTPGPPPYWLWRQLLGDPHPLDAIGSAADPAALVERIADRVRRDAGERGVALLVDDLDLADEPSLDVLRAVLPLLRDSRVLVFATHDERWRPDLPYVERVHLASPDGNPLLQRELSRYSGSGEPPQTLDELVALRLDGLAPPVRRLLAAAAILGHTVRPPLIARVLDIDGPALLAAMDEAAKAGFVVSQPDGSVEFDSGVVRAAIVAGLPPSERVTLHRRAAEAIEELAAGGIADHLGELTHHWSAAASAGASAEAAAWARRAGDEALRLHAYREAQRLYRLALDHGGADRADLLLALADAAFRAGGLAEARRACAEALDIARRTGADALVARVALTLEPCGDSTWDSDIHRWCAEALGLSTQDDATRARLLARLAQTAVYRGDNAEAETASAEAMRLAAGDTEATIAALSARQLARSGPDHAAELAGLAESMIAIGTAQRRPETEMWGRLWSIDSRWYAGDLAGIESELPRLRRATDQVGGPYARWHLLLARAALAVARAEFAEADRLVDDAVGHFERLNHPAAHGASVGFRLIMGHHRGHGDELLSPAVWDFGGDVRWELFARLGRAFVLADAGRLDEAASVYSRCGSPAGWFLAPPAELMGYAVGAQVAAALKVADDVRFLRERLSRHRGRFVVAGAGPGNFLGPVELTLGKCAAALGDWAVARADFTTASEVCGRVGAPGFRVEADCELGAALAALGDLAGAAALAERTRPMANALGMAPWSARLAFGTVTEDPLTARERQIAALVAQGLSNRGIAEALVIAERTAQNHVQHILTKLGFTNRAQIAAWVAKRSDE